MIRMIQLMEGKYDYGCVMARIDEESAKSLLSFNYNMIGEDIIYKEGTDFGREVEPHITLKYGLVKSYTEEQMKKMLREIKPFDIRVRGISLFENDEKYDVVKFDVDSPELHQLHELFGKLPNHDSHPEYHPHMTLAYVKKGNGKRFIRSPKKFARVPVKMIEYSDRGEKMYFNLQEEKMPSKLYHGTSQKLSNRIWKYGLEPGNLKNHPGYKNENGVYLTTDPKVAAHFGQINIHDNVVIVTVDTHGLDHKKFEVDYAARDSYVYKGSIPAKNVVDWKVINSTNIYD